MAGEDFLQINTISRLKQMALNPFAETMAHWRLTRYHGKHFTSVTHWRNTKGPP